MALTIHDGSLKHVAELCLCTQEAGTHKVHHAPVLHEIILQGVARQHNSPSETILALSKLNPNYSFMSAIMATLQIGGLISEWKQ